MMAKKIEKKNKKAHLDLALVHKNDFYSSATLPIVAEASSNALANRMIDIRAWSDNSSVFGIETCARVTSRVDRVR